MAEATTGAGGRAGDLSVVDLIGNTPLLKLRRIVPRNPRVEVYAKAEWYNPGGSVKDRPALNMILEGERSWRQTRERITHFVAGLGTSGTFMGTGRFLRDVAPHVRLISMQPDSPFHGLEGMKHMDSAIVPAIYDPKLADENREVGTEAAHAM